jgi:hypothetical protein
MKFWQELDQLINYLGLLVSRFMNSCEPEQRPERKQD